MLMLIAEVAEHCQFLVNGRRVFLLNPTLGINFQRLVQLSFRSQIVASRLTAIDSQPQWESHSERLPTCPAEFTHRRIGN